MEELLLATLVGWILTRTLEKKESKIAPPAPGSPDPGYSQTIGKVYMPWPNVVPRSAGDFAKLFTTDENYIWPGAICQWPNKFNVRDLIFQSFVYEQELANQWSRLSPPDRDSRAGDQIRDDIQAQQQLRKDLYNNLVMACGSYKAGSGGASPAQTISPGKIVAP